MRTWIRIFGIEFEKLVLLNGKMPIGVAIIRKGET